MKSSVLCLSLSLIIAIALFNGCSCSEDVTDDATLRLIPKEAAFVVVVDAERMGKKVIYEKLFAFEFGDFVSGFGKDDDKTDDPNAALMTSPAESGINYKDKIFMFALPGQSVSLKKEDGLIPELVGLSIKLDDQAKFERAVNEYFDAPDMKNYQGYRITSPRKGLAIGWNSKKALVLTEARGFVAESEVDILERLKTLLTQNPEASVLSDQDFKTFRNREADMRIWKNSDAYVTALAPYMFQLNLAGFKRNLFQDNYSHTYFNFEQGKITVDEAYSFNDELDQKLEGLYKKGIDLPLERLLPTDDILLMQSLSVDPDKFSALAEQHNTLGFMDTYLRNLGLTKSMIAEGIGGDIATIVIPAYKGGPDNMVLQQTGLDLLTVADIKNDSNVIGLLRYIGRSDSTQLKINPDGIGSIPGSRLTDYLSGINIHFCIKDGILALSPNRKLIRAIADGGFSTQLPAELINKARNNGLFAYSTLRFEALPEKLKGWINLLAFAAAMGGETRIKDALTASEILRDVALTAGPDGIHAEIRMADTDKNSLYTIINYFTAETRQPETPQDKQPK